MSSILFENLKQDKNTFINAYDLNIGEVVTGRVPTSDTDQTGVFLRIQDGLVSLSEPIRIWSFALYDSAPVVYNSTFVELHCKIEEL